MKISEKFVLREIAGDSLLIPLDGRGESGMVLLDQLSRLIYESIREGKEDDEILGRILSEYEVDKAEARKDIAETIDRMREIGIIEI